MSDDEKVIKSVGDLIEELQKHPLDSDIVKSGGNMFYGIEKVEKLDDSLVIII